MKDPVLQTPNPLLRQRAKPLPHKSIMSRACVALIKNMRTILAKEQFGVAIAAPQVGEPLRLFVVSGRALVSGDVKDKKKNSAGHGVY